MVPTSQPNAGFRHAWAILAGLAAVAWMLAAGLAIMSSVFLSGMDAARSWPSTDGVVVRSSVSEAPYRDTKTGQTHTRVDMDLAYEYEVDGRSYEGHRYDATGAGSGDAHRIVAEHPPGKGVRVFYDPADPADSGLSIEGSIVPYVLIGVSVLVGAIGLVFAFFSVRSLLRGRRSTPA